jgi:hypothetical protein
MNHFGAIAAGLLVAAGAVSAGVGRENPDPLPVPAIAPALEPAGDAYRLTANGGMACAISKGARLSKGLAELRLDPQCGALLPELTQAKYWQERDDGSVAFVAADLDEIVSFAAGDGIDYESFKPTLPLLSLAAM